MKRFFATGAVLAATFSGAFADLCAEGSTDDNGNWYCQEVTAITYTGAGGTGSYNKISNMDSTSGTCSSSAYAYSGSMAPLDEEVSLHFRGPLSLAKFAAYTPSSSSSKKSKKHKRSTHRHGRGHVHAHQQQHEPRTVPEAVAKRGVGDWVTATIDGVVVSWINEWSGQVATTAVTTTLAAATAAVTTTKTSLSAKATTTTSKSAPTSSSSSSSGSWGRIGYYEASSGTADGITFLNHFGGVGSGVWDDVFGNSLSYASSDGTTGASSSEVLADTTLPSNTEVIIMTDAECDGDCGYVRPGTVAYHGFDGSQKAFFFEFEMPLDGLTGSANNEDMPAIWLLNAQIPLTMQYGQADCSCWTSGCGEFDIFEVLAPGDCRAKSTLHGNIAGGDSDYFARPTSGSITVVLFLDEDDIHIKVLDSFDWSSSLDSEYLEEICTSTSTQTSAVSVFALA